MKDRKKILNDLIDKFGLEKAANMTGLSKLDLIRRSECYIDLSMANDILPDLLKEELFPRKYKNCEITFDGFTGTIDWYCDWSEDNWRDYREETTYTLATPFWDGRNGVPVDTSLYTVVDSVEQGNILSDDDFPNQECYSHIEWNDNFNSFSDYKIWIRKFYLPQVYSIIRKHLDNYRNYED